MQNLKLILGFLVAFSFHSCSNDDELPEEPMIVGPPRIEQISLLSDTVFQDPGGLLAGSLVSFDYINEFGTRGAPTDLDTLFFDYYRLAFR